MRLFVWLLLTCLSHGHLHQEQLHKVLEEGRTQYEIYQEEAIKDECWRAAVSSLNEACSDLSQTAQQRLAVAFANCHWSSAGRPTYECSQEMSIVNCTREMTDSAFDVYTQFYNHIENACFYLQSQLWQEKTERIISDLSDTSEEAVAKVKESLARHDVLQEGQEQSLRNQDQLMKSGEQLQEQLDSARKEVSISFSAIQQQAWSFKEQFNEIFLSLSNGLDGIHHILTWLLGEFISIERFFVFIIGIAIIYLLTCSQYTVQARPVLMMIVVIESVFLERWLFSWYISGNMEAATPTVMEALHFTLWIARYVTAFICFTLLTYCYMSYHNYDVINHKLLKKIIEQNRQIKEHLKLETEDVDECKKTSWFMPETYISKPSPTVIIANESAILAPATTADNEVSRPDQDSVDGEQPDSGIDDISNTSEAATKRTYNFRKRCKGHRYNKLLEQESPQQFADIVYQSEQLTRQGLRYSHSSTPKTTPSARRRSLRLNQHHITH